MKKHSIIELKGAVVDLLWAIQDADTLIEIKKSIAKIIQKSKTTEVDWWDELTIEQQAHIDEAIAEADAGENLIPHSQVALEIEATMKRLKNA